MGSFAAYAFEKKVGLKPGESPLGTGNIRGVAAPESANNAGAQTSFIPMLTLGIPPNAVMALMIGAMIIHNIQPGPQVLARNPALFWGLITSMWIGNLLNIEFNHIPYRGGGPLMNDAVNGQVPVAIATVFVTNPHVQGGKVRALGVTSAKPTPQMPGVKPVTDQGVPNFSALAWWGVIAPAKMPPPLINRMYEELNKAIKDPEVAQKLTMQGMDLIGGKPAEFDKFLKSEINRLAKVVRDNKIAIGD